MISGEFFIIILFFIEAFVFIIFSYRARVILVLIFGPFISFLGLLIGRLFGL